MRRTRANGDLDRTNDRAERRRKRKSAYLLRTKPVRDRVRRLALLQAGLRNGWLA